MRIKCDRCMGKGIIYGGVHNGVPYPVTPDRGVCWKCNGKKYVDVHVPASVEKRVERFIGKHHLEVEWMKPNSEHYCWEVYTSDYVIRFFYKGGTSIARRWVGLRR